MFGCPGGAMPEADVVLRERAWVPGEHEVVLREDAGLLGDRVLVFVEGAVVLLGRAVVMVPSRGRAPSTPRGLAAS